MITAYVSFNGSTEEAFNFYKSTLGGQITSVQRFGDSPSGSSMSDEDKNKIMHISLESPYGSLMGNDHVSAWGPFTAGNNFSLSIHPDKKDEATRLFNGLSAGGNVMVPMEKAPWGAYFGMFMDKFGMKWMINCEEK